MSLDPNTENNKITKPLLSTLTYLLTNSCNSVFLEENLYLITILFLQMKFRQTQFFKYRQLYIFFYFLCTSLFVLITFLLTE